MTRICRTCLEIIIPGERFCNLEGQPNDDLEQIKSRLESIVPQITLNVVKDPVMCFYCVDALNAAFKFKSKCIETEEKIYNQIVEIDGPSHAIDISLVVREDEKHSRDIKTEIVCEVEVFEEKLSTSFVSTEEFPVTIDNGNRHDSTVYIKIEPPDLIDSCDASISNNVASNAPVPENVSTEQFHELQKNAQLPTSTIDSCMEEESNDVIPIELNKQSCTEKEATPPPCSVAVTRFAGVIHESLKQKSVLLCASQRNSETSAIDSCVEYLHAFEETPVRSDDVIPIELNQQPCTEKEAQFATPPPCSVVITCFADVIQESLKQKSILFCALQRNSEMDSSNKIQTHSGSNDVRNDMVKPSGNKTISRRAVRNWSQYHKKFECNKKLPQYRSCLNVKSHCHKTCKNAVAVNEDACKFKDIANKNRKEKPNNKTHVNNKAPELQEAPNAEKPSDKTLVSHAINEIHIDQTLSKDLENEIINNTLCKTQKEYNKKAACGSHKNKTKVRSKLHAVPNTEAPFEEIQNVTRINGNSSEVYNVKTYYNNKLNSMPGRLKKVSAICEKGKAKVNRNVSEPQTIPSKEALCEEIPNIAAINGNSPELLKVHNIILNSTSGRFKGCQNKSEYKSKVNSNISELQAIHNKVAPCEEIPNVTTINGIPPELQKVHDIKMYQNKTLNSTSGRFKGFQNKSAVCRTSENTSKVTVNLSELQGIHNKKPPCEEMPNITIINDNPPELQKIRDIKKYQNKTLNNTSGRFKGFQNKSEYKSKVNGNISELQAIHNKAAPCEEIPDITTINGNPPELRKVHDIKKYHNKTLNSTSGRFKGFKNKSLYKSKVNDNMPELQAVHNKVAPSEEIPNITTINGNPLEHDIKKYHNKTLNNTSGGFKGFQNKKTVCRTSENKSKVNGNLSDELQAINNKVAPCEEIPNIATINGSPPKLQKGHDIKKYHNKPLNSRSGEFKEPQNKTAVYRKSENKTKVNGNLSEPSKADNTKYNKCECKTERNLGDKSKSKTESHEPQNTETYRDVTKKQTDLNSSSCKLETPTISKNKHLTKSKNLTDLNSSSHKLETPTSSKNKHLTKSKNLTDLNSSSCKLETPTSSKNKHLTKSKNLTDLNSSSHKLETPTSSKNKHLTKSKNLTDLNSSSCKLETPTSSKNKHLTKSKNLTDLNSSSHKLETLTSSKNKHLTKSKNLTDRNSSSHKLETPTSSKNKHLTKSKNLTDLNSSSHKLETPTSSKNKHLTKSKNLTDLNSSSHKLETLTSSRKRKRDKSQNKTELNRRSSESDTLTGSSKKRRDKSPNKTELNSRSHESETPTNSNEKRPGKFRNKSKLNSCTKTVRSSSKKDQENSANETEPYGSRTKSEHSYSSKRRCSLPVNLQDLEDAFMCGDCNYRTLIPSNFHHHMMIHRNEKPFKCKECKYKTTLKGNLLRHKVMHTGIKPYQCQSCTFSTSWKQSLQVHVKTNH